MTRTLSAAGRVSGPVPGWVPAVVLLAATALAGPALGGLSRIAFIAGCGAAGWYAWRRGPGEHLQAALVLFAFAPFARRVVDLAVGYDQAGIMLVGPLLALLAPLPQLVRRLESDRPFDPRFGPILLVGACVAYATALSLFQGDLMNAATGALKWSVPLLYAAVLIDAAEPEELVRRAAAAFLVILPAIGLYGIWQYVDPPNWDRYWMSFAPIMSAGQPIPFGVRTFSTMNGPASFATFTAVGLLLVGFLRPPWQTFLFASPAALALLLSLYRTAWLSLAVGLLFCLAFAVTRRRSATVLIGLVGAAVIAATLTPFGEVIGERLSTLTEGSQDGSAQERLEQYVTLWSQWDSSLLGVGFTVTDVGSAGAMAIDGMIIACWLSMGIVGGLACLAGFVWAAGRAIAAAVKDGRREAVLVGALACGGLVQMPLSSIAAGELGFLFWTFVVLVSPAPRAPVRGTA
ncbi:O-antigen ligase family protein [Rhodoplanes sp. TEM]|uniref:O-antigen ligase family protein n=1 Tax=Rhodoplanes tepidamans TaxID=200616 RepID=A0ABT5JBX9_RHOTP|nr:MULTISPECIES: O-antigen ligase family protein [Rhodoplanes]MDC7787139.1 O-antigen ligase family protein [Rhodoplanes tepidamans]MDC7984297.1 O-antigen ligase family protein [Rhodoplanes sp. TEM]MDQ0356094.1 O-antigen ligase [Rhodoplanes tepidamans]